MIKDMKRKGKTFIHSCGRTKLNNDTIHDIQTFFVLNEKKNLPKEKLVLPYLHRNMDQYSVNYRTPTAE
jgi:hypothetical protein